MATKRGGSGSSRRFRRRHGDRGATLVEAAFAMPIFILLLFGVIEFAGVVMTYTGTGNASQAAARMASIQGNSAMADQQILLRLATEAAGLPKGEIEQIVIWHASGPGDSPPAACTATGSAGVGGSNSNAVGNCNVYNDPEAATTGAFARAKAADAVKYFGCTSPDDGYNSQRLDCKWPAHLRKVAQGKPGTDAGNAGIGPDYVGIYIKAKHGYYTGMFGSAVTVTDKSIGRIEPQEYTSTT